MDWAKERRANLRQLYAQALIGIGRIHNRRNEFHEALGFFTRALKETPEREDIHCEVMQTYIKLEMPDDARRQYRYLEQALDDILGIEPSQETRDIYESI